MPPLRTASRYACAALLAAGALYPTAARSQAPAPPQSSVGDSAIARRYFEQIARLSALDGGRLWGVELYGPILFVDPATRELVANVADSAGRLAPRGGLYLGTLPPEQNVANTAFQWAGQRWTMLLWPLPVNRYDRQRLVMHELFHRVQPALGITGGDPANAHLETRDGRIWLRLEWRALEEALLREGEARTRAVSDALTFRAMRRALFPETAAAEERLLEWNEGLAEYTGLTLSGLPKAVLADRAAVALAERERSERFARGFAYASGPAYGVLLDQASVRWRDRARVGTDLGELLAEAYGVEPTGVSAEHRAAAYDGERLIAAETRRAERIAAEQARLRQRFLEGPTLRLLPEGSFRYSFDPNAAVPLADAGTVYETSRISADWGVLTVESGGVLLERGEGGITGVRVPLPAGVSEAPLAGEGWRLELAEGWRVVGGDRLGDWKVVRRE